MKKLLGKLKETSTWKGLVFILTACGVALSQEQQDAIIAAGVGLIGLIEVFQKD